jgi:PPOX class probable F420-dependent enzyme
MKDQRRGRRISMTDEERNAYLATARTCRVATLNGDGSPHLTPLWFVWDGASIWLTSITQSQRWQNLQRNHRVAVVVDDGDDFTELRGVELNGSATPVGEIPRTGKAVAELEVPEHLFADKYAGGRVTYDGRHAWLRITPDKIVSWDFRKNQPIAPD